MGTTHQPRVQAGTPAAGQFAPSRSSEPQNLGIATADAAIDAPPVLAGIAPYQHDTVLGQYIETAMWSSIVLGESDDDDNDVLMADDEKFELSDAAKRELMAEAAELWAAIPPDLRGEVLDSVADMGGVFHAIRLSVTGNETGFWHSAGLDDLGERVAKSLKGTEAQRKAEHSGAFYVNDETGELEYGW